jgi:hypothetical protein
MQIAGQRLSQNPMIIRTNVLFVKAFFGLFRKKIRNGPTRQGKAFTAPCLGIIQQL